MNYRSLLIIFITGISSLSFPILVLAQNRPQIQKISVRAPANIKIDGELKEWGDKSLKAYNVANRIYYVVSNDDDNLYLTVRGSGATSAFKILKEGVTFTVSHSFDKAKRSNDSQNVTINYPTSQNALSVSSMMVPVFRIESLVKDTIKNRKDIDSLTIIANARVGQVGREIKVIGIKELKDSLLSVYNDKGIKAMFHFFNGEPIIEIAIPLKYLNLKINPPERFSYNIKLSVPRLSGDFNIADLQKSGDTSSGIPPDLLYRITDTELWGEYTLAKKPQ